MKSEERHKLHQNALGTWIAQTMIAVKPYQNAILGGIIVVLLAIIATTWWTSESAAQAETAWSQFFSAFDQGSVSDLEKVAEVNKRSKAAPVADLTAADILLAQGCNMLFINKATANQDLNKAVQLYQNVREQSNSPIIRCQATFGLAKARESQGQLETAKKLYTEVTTDWADTVYAQMAARRLEDLNRSSIKGFYDVFTTKFDPKPAFSTPAGDKSIFDKLPEESPIYVPDTTSAKKTEEEKTEPKQEEKKEDVKKEDVKQDNAENTTDATKPAAMGDKPVDAQK